MSINGDNSIADLVDLTEETPRLCIELECEDRADLRLNSLAKCNGSLQTMGCYER